MTIITEEEAQNLIRNKELKFKPEDISYDAAGVGLKTGWTVLSGTPRLLFAKLLDLFDDESEMVSNQSNAGGPISVRNNTVLGDNTLIGAYCVIGGDGFGFERLADGTLFKMKHHGNVVIGKNVEIHSNVTIDRAVLGSTVIGDGTRIDNNVQVAHNVRIGKNCLIVAGTTIGGSTEVGNGCYIGMNVCIKNRKKIGRHCMIGMGAVVVKDVPDYAVVCGNPAKIIGWQSEWGERLNFDKDNCAKSKEGAAYRYISSEKVIKL